MAGIYKDQDGREVYGENSAAVGGAGGSTTAPSYVQPAQGTVNQSAKTLVAGTAQTVLPASPNRRGARIVNYTASPVYLAKGETGTPASGAPSDYIPAATSGVPGQWEPPYSPVDGVRAVGASAGDLAVYDW